MSFTEDDDADSNGRVRGSYFVELGSSGPALAQPAKSVVGTVSLFKAETAEIEIKPDNGAAVAMKVTADTIAQKVAPGVTDLKKAESIKVTDVALGDRVLATPEPGTSNLRRIVVMSGHGHCEEE